LTGVLKLNAYKNCNDANKNRLSQYLYITIVIYCRLKL